MQTIILLSKQLMDDSSRMGENSLKMLYFSLCLFVRSGCKRRLFCGGTHSHHGGIWADCSWLALDRRRQHHLSLGWLGRFSEKAGRALTEAPRSSFWKIFSAEEFSPVPTCGIALPWLLPGGGKHLWWPLLSLLFIFSLQLVSVGLPQVLPLLTSIQSAQPIWSSWKDSASPYALHTGKAHSLRSPDPMTVSCPAPCP